MDRIAGLMPQPPPEAYWAEITKSRNLAERGKVVESCARRAAGERM